MIRKLLHALLATTLILLALPAQADSSPTVLRMATTTSTENSGLLNALLPKFEAENNMEVHVLAVGTGHALKLGCNGDVDVVLVHAPAAEQKFVDQGCGVNRRQVMYNDFVIVGPEDDPADVAGTTNAASALARIAATRSLFVSRGDDSGTNKKERHLWEQAKISPSGDWYREAGQGMGKVLQITGELDAYTLTDRGTWIAYRNKLPLHIVLQNDPELYNPYGVIAVNPDRYADTNYAGAMRFISWITAPEGQHLIANYQMDGQQLFTPLAITRISHNAE